MDLSAWGTPYARAQLELRLWRVTGRGSRNASDTRALALPLPPGVEDLVDSRVDHLHERYRHGAGGTMSITLVEMINSRIDQIFYARGKGQCQCSGVARVTTAAPSHAPEAKFELGSGVRCAPGTEIH